MASNPFKAPTEQLYQGAPKGSIHLSDEYFALRNSYLGREFPVVLDKRFTLCPSFPIPRELSADNEFKRMGSKDGVAKLATAKKAAARGRNLSNLAQGNVRLVLEKMPLACDPSVARFGHMFCREVAEEAIKGKVYASSGVEGSYTRLLTCLPSHKAIPPLAFQVPNHFRLKGDQHPNKGEVKAALTFCGFDNDVIGALEKLPIEAVGAEQAIKSNVRSCNGFPVLSNMSNPEAYVKVLRLTRTVLDEFSSRRIDCLTGKDSASVSFHSIKKWYELNWNHRQHLIAVLGKTKSDYYKQAKVQECGMRFYNVFPRQLLLIMQTVTQPLESSLSNILDDPILHTAKGMSYAHGGADRFISALEQQLKGSSMAWAHAGDDTFAAMRLPSGHVVLFSVDCTAFDLTQRAELREPVLERIRDCLRRMDADAADLWFEMQSRRMVVLANNVVVEMKHGGPSGGPLQSVINDVIMEIYMSRLHVILKRNGCFSGDSAITVESRKAAVSKSIIEAGDSLALTVRLEEYFDDSGSSEEDVYLGISGQVLRETYGPIKAALFKRPFLFLGYYLYFDYESKQVLPYIDIARSLAQRATPSEKWVTPPGMFEMMETGRLASIIVGSGIPPHWLREAHEAQRAFIIARLEHVISIYRNVIVDDKLRWASGADAMVVDEIEPSVKGLLKVFKEDRDRSLWLPRVDEPQRQLSVREVKKAIKAEKEELKEKFKEERNFLKLNSDLAKLFMNSTTDVGPSTSMESPSVSSLISHPIASWADEVEAEEEEQRSRQKYEPLPAPYIILAGNPRRVRPSPKSASQLPKTVAALERETRVEAALWARTRRTLQPVLRSNKSVKYKGKRGKHLIFEDPDGVEMEVLDDEEDPSFEELEQALYEEDYAREIEEGSMPRDRRKGGTWSWKATRGAGPDNAL